jgi:hypothetical protein
VKPWSGYWINAVPGGGLMSSAVHKVLVIAVMRTAMAWLCGFVEHHGFVVKDAKLMILVIIRIEFAVMLVMEKWCGEEVMGL